MKHVGKRVDPKDIATQDQLGGGSGTVPNPFGARILMLSGRLRLQAS